MADRQRKWIAATAVLVFAAGLAVSAYAQQNQQQTQQNQQAQQQQAQQNQQTQGQQTQSQGQANPQRIADSVQTGLQNQLTGLEDLGVTFQNGTLTLSGTVGSQQQKQLAGQIAQNVQGVDDVQNNLTVRGSQDQQAMQQSQQQPQQQQVQTEQDQQAVRQQPAESRLARQIRSRLQQNNVQNADRFTINTREGRAVIFGRVDTQQKKDQIAQIARQVSGVNEIDNRIIVSAEAAQKNDAALKEAIEEQLYWSWFVDADDVDVQVQDGTATLTGAVEGWAELNAAIENAYEGGAQKVVTDLTISGRQLQAESGFAADTAQQRRPTAAQQRMRRAPEGIQGRPGDEFIYGYDEGERIYSGGTWYDGERPATYPQDRAYQQAQDRYGDPYAREMMDQARARQAYDRQRGEEQQVQREQQFRREATGRLRQAVPGGEDIYVGYRQGTVVLYGNVDDQQTRRRAADTLRDLPGVSRVDNRIRVRREGETRQARKSDAQLREDIREQYALSWFVDADSIDLNVNDGIVTLTGTVDSWGEMNDAILNAFQAGARRVVNHLRIAGRQGSYRDVMYRPGYDAGYQGAYDMGSRDASDREQGGAYDAEQGGYQRTGFFRRGDADTLYHRSWSQPYLPDTVYNEDYRGEQRPDQQFDRDYRRTIQRQRREREQLQQDTQQQPQQYRDTGGRNQENEGIQDDDSGFYQNQSRRRQMYEPVQ